MKAVKEQIRLDKTKPRPQLHLSSLSQTKNVASDQNGQFSFMHINIIFFALSSTLQPGHKSGLCVEIDFFSSIAKCVIEKEKLVLCVFSNNKSTIITSCFHGGSFGQVMKSKWNLKTTTNGGWRE